LTDKINGSQKPIVSDIPIFTFHQEKFKCPFYSGIIPAFMKLKEYGIIDLKTEYL